MRTNGWHGGGEMTTMLQQPFILHALLAGSAVAVLCGLVGYFLVLRGQVFAGDALGHVAYTGAMAALAAGLDPRVGLFGATIAAGMALGANSRRSTDDVTIGSFFSWVLGLGVLFLTYYTTHGSARNGTANVNVLFGSIFGISTPGRSYGGRRCHRRRRPAAGNRLAPSVFDCRRCGRHRGRGARRLLGALLLAVVGATVAEATQIVGALLVLGLLAAPAGGATRLTTRPWHAFWLSATLAAAAIWVGVTLAYLVPKAPASFTIMICAAATYAIAALLTARGRSSRSHSPAT